VVIQFVDYHTEFLIHYFFNLTNVHNFQSVFCLPIDSTTCYWEISTLKGKDNNTIFLTFHINFCATVLQLKRKSNHILSPFFGTVNNVQELNPPSPLLHPDKLLPHRRDTYYFILCGQI